MSFKRSSGILLHITSLPGKWGVGGLGEEAYSFVDFLHDTRQRFWQFLPMGPGTGIFDYSPYMSLSAFAGNPLLIDPQILVDQGLLDHQFLETAPECSKYTVEFDKVVPFKYQMFAKAFEQFRNQSGNSKFEKYCRRHAGWLDDYALFMSLREKFELLPWCDWPRSLALRNNEALQEAKTELAAPLLFHKFIQFCFHSQWEKLREYANKKGISLVGDIPIYVSFDSADVWANQDCFMLNRKTLLPSHVAGVPPDYFSETGQRWGNPLYKWKLAKGDDNNPIYTWWAERFKAIFEMVDVCRIDHFRAFESYWKIPAKEETAIKGTWAKGPGRKFFELMAQEIGDLPIIAEDLGIITPAVERLRDEVGFPGMKILQFAFDTDENNAYLPHNFTSSNCVVYTGTHDNNTTLGWFMSEKATEEARARALRYARSDGSQIHWDFVRLALSSVADVAFIPMQDILGFGEDCRMNMPGTATNNWRWRLVWQFVSDEIKQRLRDETCFYGRG